ncbi:Dyp-type peroxidase [Corynebacterium sp. H128]|uniref:Dyp-type peroxidase n=1 Tax=Corynebacterium sp. H128 TaxID=3133427 RepID=UPI0030A06205
MSKSRITRRDFLTASATTVAGGVVASCAAPDVNLANGDQQPIKLAAMVEPFAGDHQAGVTTPGQAHLNLVAFTLRPEVDRKRVIQLMKLWTEDARRLTSGETPLGDLEPELTMAPSKLTITCGFGARLFEIIGEDVPDFVKPIKAFKRDKLNPQWGEADVVLQFCSDDPMALAHATRHMIRAGIDYVATRWMQQGFLHAYGAKTTSDTPRNLFGQVDGTINPHTEEKQREQVWIDNGPEWAINGSVMVVRRISMNLDTWEILDRPSREVSMGRRLDNGAPLTGNEEFDTPDFDKTDEFGLPVIDRQSHIARATAPKDHPEQRLLRRAYNYDIPVEPGSEQTSNSGLVFVCFQKDPRKQFEPIQERLDEQDRLNQWIEHIGSAVFFIPPGVTETSYWGAGLLEK